MDDEKRPPPDKLDKFHGLLDKTLQGYLPTSGETEIVITVNEAVGLLCEYVYLKGMVTGLSEGGKLLKSIIENR